jgi:hypothetical protein
MKFRKKPVVIDAVQYTGSFESQDEVADFMDFNIEVMGNDEDVDILIPTLEGEMRASKGDWIIKGVRGEFYPCKPDIFEITYESVEE